MDINSNATKSLKSSIKNGFHSSQEKKVIGIDGQWYDITSFIPHHPGGEVIEQFVGKDASALFHAFHKPLVLKYRRPCAKMDKASVENDSITQSFAQLGKFFEEEGYFKTNYIWYFKKILLTATMLVTCIFLTSQESGWKYIGAVLLAAFWQQCGFFMHDSEHNQLSQNRHIDSKIGTFFATVCFGVSGTWWRSDHFTHHALTACVDFQTDFIDPQMREAIWAQNVKLWPFYTTTIEYYCIKIQHFTFLPACIFLGRIGIMIDSMKNERQPSQVLAFLLHWIWVLTLLSKLSDLREMVIFYAIAASLQGILHIQLLISHYSKTFHHLQDFGLHTQWYKRQIESNIDIDAPYWMDWFHGGLNFHLVHHLYPRMPRHNFRKATIYVKRICKQHGLLYDHCGWFEAIYRTLQHLRLMAEHFSLDPR